MDIRKKVAGGHFCRVRLDRALATAGWSSIFPFASVRHLVAAKSDHSPIILFNDLEAANRRIAIKRPFRYEKMWETHNDFLPMLEATWAALGKAEMVKDTSRKLEAVATALATWGKVTFGQVRSELRSLKRRLEELRSEPTRQGPSYEEKKVEQRIIELNYREEIMWRQNPGSNGLLKETGIQKISPESIDEEKEKQN